MTTSRVIRGTRAKVFLYICAILIIVGIIACYNNTLSQLDDVRKSNEICHQQEENLSTQLQGPALQVMNRPKLKNIAVPSQNLPIMQHTKKLNHASIAQRKLRCEMRSVRKDANINLQPINETSHSSKVEEVKHKKIKFTDLGQEEQCAMSLLQLKSVNNKKIISDYKQRLEKSLKTEQADHQQIKTNLENQLKEERSKYENEANDMKLKLGSVQQHLNLLQTQYDDYKEDSDKTQKQQQEEINNLEARITELLEEQKKLRSSKESLKAQFNELQQDKEKLAKEVQEHKNKVDNTEELEALKKENAEVKEQVQQLKEKCSQDIIPEPKLPKGDDSENKLDNNIENNDKQELHVLPEPNEVVKGVSSSSTPSSKLVVKPSQPSLGIARPIFLPTATPETVAKDNKLPDGVVAIPDKKEEEIVNDRYQNARESANEPAQGVKAAKEESEKDNVAHEVFDGPLFHDGLQFDNNDQFKQVDKPNFDKRHIDTLGAANEKEKKNYDQDQADYKDLQNDVQLEENDDDDGDGYDDHLVRQKEPAVRD